MEPSLQIQMVRENLALSIAISAAAQRRVITAAFLPGRVDFIADNGHPVSVSAPLQLGDNRDLIRCVDNQIRGAFALSAINTHRVLESLYGAFPLQEYDPDLKAARCTFYLLHNTLCQELLAPVWACPPEYRICFDVRPIGFSLDASTLQGKEMFWDDFGGLGKYLDLLEYCATQVKSCLIELPEQEAHKVNGFLPANGAGSGLPPTDSVAAFVADCGVVGATEMIIAKDLYSTYQHWCREVGQAPVGQRLFGMRLTALGFERRRRGRGRHWWVGIGVAVATPAD